MSLLSVVQSVCSVVGVARPTALFSGSASNRTAQEMIDLANEMAQRIAYETHDWTKLRNVATIVGDGTETGFYPPADYKRMLVDTQLRSSTQPQQPLRFIHSFDEWLSRRLSGTYEGGRGEWIINGGQVVIEPPPGAGVVIKYPYLDKNCIEQSNGNLSDTFIADEDKFRLSERVLKLGMIWQWKAHKGSPYAEDLSTYGEALQYEVSRDNPAPIIVGTQPLSAGIQTAYPYPVTGPAWPFP